MHCSSTGNSGTFSEAWESLLKRECETLKQQYLDRVKYDNQTELTSEQRFLVLLAQAFNNPNHYSNDILQEGSWNMLQNLQRLPVKAGFCQNPPEHLEHIKKIAKEFGVIVVGEPRQAERPKLVIGCGSRLTMDENEHWTKYHSHSDADTIDPFIGQCPTWVGEFAGSPFHDLCCHPHSHFLVETVGENHYQTIYDEAPLHAYDHEVWKQIDTLLKPGGMFIGSFYPWQNHIPIPKCHSSLRLQPWRIPLVYNGDIAQYFTFTEANKSKWEKPWWTDPTGGLGWGKFIVTKADENGNHPTDLSQIKLEDFPDSCRPQADSTYVVFNGETKEEEAIGEAKSIWKF